MTDKHTANVYEMGNGRHDTRPIRNTATAPWDLQVSEDDAKKLIAGFTPREMEDKWFCYTDTPDASGAISIHFCSSWTRDEHMVLKLERVTQGQARVSQVTWEADDDESDRGLEQIKELTIMVCNGVLGCSLDEDDE